MSCPCRSRSAPHDCGIQAPGGLDLSVAVRVRDRERQRERKIHGGRLAVPRVICKIGARKLRLLPDLESKIYNPKE
jgi:hypothetical protein